MPGATLGHRHQHKAPTEHGGCPLSLLLPRLEELALSTALGSIFRIISADADIIKSLLNVSFFLPNKELFSC